MKKNLNFTVAITVALSKNTPAQETIVDVAVAMKVFQL